MAMIETKDLTLESVEADKMFAVALREAQAVFESQELGFIKKGPVELSLKVTFRPDGQDITVACKGELKRPGFPDTSRHATRKSDGGFHYIDAEQPVLPGVSRLDDFKARREAGEAE